MTSNAIPVTWELEGLITNANPTGSLAAQLPSFADVTAGELFDVLLSFDTDATLLRTQSGGVFDPGVRYEFDPASISFVVRIGSRAALDFAASPSGESTTQILYARDNSGDQFQNGEAPAQDGYSFGVDNDLLSIGTIMRGPVLDIVNDSTLPTTPDSQWAALAVSIFQIFSIDGSGGFITGDITSVRAAATSVPEPSTLALFGIGLAGLAALRKRRAK